MTHFFLGYNLSDFKPLYCQSYKIGFVSVKVEKELMDFQDTFTISPDKIDICPGLKSYSDISDKVASVLDSMKKKNILRLHGETFDIRQSMGMAPLFAMDRAAVNMFGLLQYYVIGSPHLTQNSKQPRFS